MFRLLSTTAVTFDLRPRTNMIRPAATRSVHFVFATAIIALAALLASFPAVGLAGFGTLSGGTLSFGGPGDGQNFSGNIVDNGLLIFSSSANCTLTGNISGSGGLTVASGTLTLSGSDTYTGDTNINAGCLEVDGSLVSPATVNGGILSGTGTLGGATVNSGGHLAPGDLNTGALVIAGDVDFEGGNLDIVATGSSITSLSIAGNLILNGDPTLNVSGSLAPGTYTIASYGGTLSGGDFTLNIPAGDTINYGTGSDSAITLSVTPEPSTLALLAAGVIGLAGWAWRRRATRTVKPTAVGQQDAPAILSFPSHASTASAARRAA
jgi:autotransporter-associated beta strand protein